MSNPGKFSNSSFHKEGRPVAVTASAKTTKSASKPQDSEFVQELVQTGKVNWKKAPKQVKTRYYGIYLILFSIPFIVIPSIEMYRRLDGKSTKKVREGELLPGKQIRKFDEQEKWEVEKNSLMYKLFGRDWFLDGFTSKTMGSKSDSDDQK
jgi:hypothetical protein